MHVAQLIKCKTVQTKSTGRRSGDASMFVAGLERDAHGFFGNESTWVRLRQVSEKCKDRLPSLFQDTRPREHR